MILRRFGSAIHRVDPAFDSKALTEIKFQRDPRHTQPTSEFLATYEHARVHELTGHAEGWVQDEVEQALLADLEGQLKTLDDALGEGEVLMVESEPGVDYPKTHTQQKTVVVEGENRFHFTSFLHPALRIGLYRKTGGSA